MTARKPPPARTDGPPRTGPAGDVPRLAERFGLPLHCYDAGRIASNLKAFQDLFGQTGMDGDVCYAVKACGFAEVIRIAAGAGAGADVASEYELALALKAGIPADRMIIHGNAKSARYLERSVALKALIAANHHTELDRIEAEAERQQKAARVLLRLSGFDLGSITAGGIFTAGTWCKFGEPVQEVPALLKVLKKWPHIELIGFHVHIGSQITELTPYRLVLGRLADLSAQFQQILGRPPRVLNLGGGFPVSYLDRRAWNNLLKAIRKQYSRDRPHPGPLPSREREKKKGPLSKEKGRNETRWAVWEGMSGGFKPDPVTGTLDLKRWGGERFYAPFPKEGMLSNLLGGKVVFQGKDQSVKKVLARIGNPKLMVEPGRAVVGDAGSTLARVIEVYEVAGGYPLVTLDLGIVNHGTGLVEPDLYPWTLAGAFERKHRRPFKAFVAGRLCFSGDMISRYLVSFPRKPIPGDIAVIEKTGAYAPTFFASRANGFPCPKHILVKGNELIPLS